MIINMAYPGSVIRSFPDYAHRMSQGNRMFSLYGVVIVFIQPPASFPAGYLG